LAEKCELYIQSILNNYVKLARYNRKGATQREAEPCGLSTHRCHHFPENSLAEIASQTPVEYAQQKQKDYFNPRLPQLQLHYQTMLVHYRSPLQFQTCRQVREAAHATHLQLVQLRIHKCSCTFSIPVVATYLGCSYHCLLKLETYSGAISFYLLLHTLFGSEAATQIPLPGLK